MTATTAPSSLRYLLSGLRASFAADPRTSAVLTAVITVNMFGGAAVAYGLGTVVSRVATDGTRMVVLAALGVAVGQALVEIGFRIQFTLRLNAQLAVDRELRRELARLVSSVATVAHLEDPEQVDRIATLRRQSADLAASGWNLLEGLSVAVQICLSAFLLATVSPPLALLVVLAAPGIVLARRARNIETAALDAAAEDDRLALDLTRTLTSAGPAGEAAVTGAATLLRDTVEAAWSRATARRAAAAFRAGSVDLIGFTIFTAGFLGAIAVSLTQIAAGRVEPGALLMVVTLAARLQGQAGHAVWVFGELKRSVLAARRFAWAREEMGRPRDGSRQPAPGHAALPPLRPGGSIRFSGVTFAYQEGTPVLHNIDLDLPTAGTVAVVGLNGAGKSTLVKLVAGLYHPTSGRIEVDGVPLCDVDPQTWRAGISAVYQDFARFELTVRESVGLGRVASMDDDHAVRTALREAGGDFTDRLPQGIQTRLGPTFGGTDLSLGQWQKLAVARARMRRSPRVLIADEPTASLDVASEAALNSRLFAWRQSGELGLTLVVTHRLSTVTHADLIVVLDAGRVTEVGSHAALMRAGHGYARLFALQSEAYA